MKGAVHIDDVAAAVILSLDLISRQHIEQQLVLTLDSAYEYTDADLGDWDAEGPGVKRHAKGTPLRHWFGLVPVADRRAPRASRSALTSDGAARVGGCLFAHRGKPGRYSGSSAVLEAPGLVPGFNDFAVMGQPIE